MQQQSKMGFMDDMEATKQSLTLADRFVVPPFSILDTRQGYWQEHKRQWLALGIQSEVGRGGNARCFGEDLMKGENPHFGQGVTREPIIPNTKSIGDKRWSRSGNSLANVTERIETGETYSEAGMKIAAVGTGISIFDPVLCELAYKWFCPSNGGILDPFAGGSVRGIVAEMLGYKYTGIEIRKEQVEANEQQATTINLSPRYILGDSTKLLELLPQGELYDLIFTCPPYYDLEVYSDVLDNMGDMSVYHSYFSFMIWYELIFKQAVSRLRTNRFLVVVVGEIRDKQGEYRNFVGDSIACFKKLGLRYYNEAILVTAVGSLPVRVANQFPSGRKLGKSHQNVLVFYKGDMDKIKDLSFVDKVENGT